ncbi:energy transducer TonB [Planctomycetota bacterium]
MKDTILKPRAGTVVLATLLAAGTFLILPLFGILSEARHESLRITQAPDIASAPKKTSYVRPKDVDLDRPRRRPELKLKPRLARPRRQMDALKAQLSLSMGSLLANVGDFSLDFEIDPIRGLADEYGTVLFGLTELDEYPRPLVRVRPVYPHHARQKGIEGFAELVFVISPEGRVSNPHVIRSEPATIFDAAAKAAVTRWRFSPPQKDGKPVATYAKQTIRFELAK